MSHPRIAEVDDDDDIDMADDPDEVDVSAFDFARPQQGTLGGPSSSSTSTSTTNPSSTPQPSQPMSQHLSDDDRERLAAAHREKSKHYQCLYPLYFDDSRSRAEGRRVSKEDAVSSPLARALVDALQAVGRDLGVGLQIVFEPNKVHPNDWANPGRVRVEIKREGKPVSAKLQNKHHLYTLVAAYLKKNPTQPDDPMKLRLQGMPPMDSPPPPPAVPRGFRISKVLPLHSPALSGGGVSDNMFSDMMAEMQGMAGGGMPGAIAGGGGAPPKKEKKDKKRK